MVSKHKKNKFIYDTRLFATEPPDDPGLIESLFCGRQQEIQRALDTLKHNMDRNGNRTAKKPWVIVGESRSGKSHLARYVMRRLEKTRREKKYHFISVSARERLDPFEVIKLLFDQVCSLYRDLRHHVNFSPDSLPHPINEHAKSILPVIDGMIDRVTHLLEQNTDTLELSLSEAETLALQGQVGWSIVPTIFKLIGQLGWNRQQTTAQKIVFRQPTTNDLVEYCVAILDTLCWLKLLDHVLILVDDIDLLEGYHNPLSSGQIQRNRLTDAILKLHDMARVDVLLTARSWYGQTHKELQILVDLSTGTPLTEDEFQTIHDKHFQAFVGRKQLPKQFLTPDALRYVAVHTNQLPGVFLQILKNAFHDHYKAEEGWEPRDRDWLLDVYRRRFGHLLSHVPSAASGIQKAIGGNQLTIDIREDNLYLHTIAMDEFVYQSYFSETTLFIPPFIKEVVSSIPTTSSSQPSLEHVVIPPNQ